MSFRTKFFLVLLVFSLMPLLLMRTLVNKVSQDRLEQATETARQDILELMSLGLQETARGASEILANQGMAYAQSARVLAMEAQRLRGEAPSSSLPPLFSSEFAEMEKPSDERLEAKKYERRTMSGRIRPLPVRFGKVSLTLAPGVERADVERDVQWLSGLSDIMRTLYEDMGGQVWWIHVYLDSGVSAVYPAHGNEPPHYDPRETEWYLRMSRFSSVVWSMPHVDPASRRVIGSVGYPVRDRDGRHVGLAVVDVLLSDILLETMVTSEWGSEQKPFLLLREDHPETGAPALRILGQMDYTKGGRHWMTPFDTEWLSSDDTMKFAGFLREVREKESGTMRMPYKGKDSIWAFASQPEYTYLIIVPETAVAAIPDAIVGSFDDFLEQWRLYVGLSVLGVILLCAVVAWFWARSSTRTLLAVSEAARKIGEGDFEVRIDSWTGDERDDFIRTINEVGPKLKDHMKLSRDLDLARTVQEHLLPREQPEIPGWEISGGIVYCDQTGGIITIF
ncbi:PDC sensor domain-containing protein [Salidesulfovibrio onnuriiensis]|uniref:PDC sensor domain-containing protein n=1 Tax=Salidesulfovibrio onnuriiensis TaxID=2583823 RepID=UPI00164F3DF7|nr:methyl-accepting chemotaxis protein [Salidesulfovibrio onnuriiensis]